jgi:hypothetical protein
MSLPGLRSAGAALVLAGALVLTAIFLAQHRAEIASLGAASGAFAAVVRRYGVVGAAGAHTVAGVIAAALVVAAWYGLGQVLLRGLASLRHAGAGGRTPAVGALPVASACAIGAGVWSLVWFALGLVGGYRSGVALVAVACGLALVAVGGLRRTDTRSAAADDVNGRTPLSVAMQALVAFAMAAAAAGALAPPTAKDALQYHLALPKAFAAAGGLTDVPGNVANYFALGAEMHGLSAMLLGRLVSAEAGEVAFGAVMFAFLPLLLAAVFGWAREAGASREWAWLAAAMVSSAPTVVEVAGSGYVDLALALYVALAIRALARWSDMPEPSGLVELCLLLACALAIKLTAGFVVLFCALVVLLRSRAIGSDGSMGHRRLVAGLAAIALGSPWYLRTWVRTGSPVFPFFAHILPGRAPGWDPERSAMLVGFNAHYGGVDKGALDYLLTPLLLSVAGHREVAAAYEGVLGAAFLLGAVLVVWAFRRLGAPLRLVALAAGAFFLWWLASAQVLRYLFPALPLLAVATAGAGAVLTASTRAGGMLRWALAAPVAAGAVVTAAWLVADNPLLVAAGAEPRAAYLERRLEHYAYYRVINASLPRDATVWLVNMRRDTYHLERAYTGDYLFEDYTLRRWIEGATSGRDVQRCARDRGNTHVLIRHDVLFDPATSPLVRDDAPSVDNHARLERLRAFLADGTSVVRVDRRFALVELPTDEVRERATAVGHRPVAPSTAATDRIADRGNEGHCVLRSP